jgi:hypothetical protein
LSKNKLIKQNVTLPKKFLENLEYREKESTILELRAVQCAFGIPLFVKREEVLLVNIINNTEETFQRTCIVSGYKKSEIDKAEKFLTKKSVAKLIYYFHQKKDNSSNITRDKLTDMAMECYSERLNCSEGIKAIEVLAKLHGLNKEQQGSRITINNQQNSVKQSKKEDEKFLKTLSTDELKKLASNEINSINIEDKRTTK